MNIGIIGGGIAGLTAAYQLSKAGHRVTVFEKEPELGGQAATFEVGGERVERFYHHIFAGDQYIQNLIKELGLGDRLVWLESKVGYWHGGKIYKFSTPLDLLRFKPLGLLDRVRLGLVGLYLRWYKNWQRYEGTIAREWIMKYAGRRSYEVLWGPLLRGKFGQSASEVGMVWFWGKIHLRFSSRGKGAGGEKLGYLKGSFGLVPDALAQRITASGGTIYTGSPVSRVVAEEGKVTGLEAGGNAAGFHPFDTVIATVPSHVFLDMVPQLEGEYAAKLRNIRYQAAVCAVFILKKSLSPIYWLNISDSEVPFVAAIEHTNFVDSSVYGGRHILYISNYLSKDNPLYSASIDKLQETFLPHLKRINPEFDTGWIEERYRFSEDAGQPIVGTYYSRQIPEHRTPIDGLYLANTTQIYPEDRGMNYSVRLGLDVSKLIE